MPSKTTKAKPKGRGSSGRPMEKPDPLRLKMHDLANSLEAISLAAQFITRRPKVVPLLETLSGALRDTRRILQQMDAALRSSREPRRQSAGR